MRSRSSRSWSSSISSARSSFSRAGSVSRSSTRRSRRRRSASGGGRIVCRPCSSARPRSTSACSGTASRARSRASTSCRAGSAKRCAGSSGSATRRVADSSCGAQCRRAAAGRAARRGSREPARQRLLPAAARLPARRRARRRARLPGAQAARRRSAPGEVRQLAGRRSFPQGRPSLWTRPGRQAIAKEDRAVVVEGNTDVLALRQAGFLPVVASMGTALTERQLRELARLTRRLFLCFDATPRDRTRRCAEWISRSRRVSTSRSSRCHAAPIRPTTRRRSRSTSPSR